MTSIPYDGSAVNSSENQEVYKVSSKFRDAYARGGDIVIYGLVCPIADTIFYIGKTNNPQYRLENHASQHWYFQELSQHEQEYTFRLVVIERIPQYEYHPSRETYWILKYLERGVQLKNKMFPTTMPAQWMQWLDDICHLHGWVNQKTHNNRVRELPDYGGGS